ncbi:nitrate- and nitrite sensing domain-containing protein [Nocardiopsis changdeensis]|uniref:histidine kinase n=1 Tax=Nocardiopsis changdeensis TaxID=2831969 RepID=A0ABX8BVT6_9ACTN|nr:MULTISPECIES: nitrate- and nitrite sensing domain-containing protein [Nocardiopsis]QUX26169.1 nitrate- and nitrite sensing domain-containing protein [Nocardiopsis changdeensis]QYX39958.1 nitrate- and nitrite sensing domain-containing protein [Nocardiopsis sp. MT53]
MRSRLVALIVIPTAVALALGGLRVYEAAVSTVTHAHIEDRAEVGVLIVQLANQLGRERSASAVYISDDPDPARRSDDKRQALEEERAATLDLQQTLNARLEDIGEVDGSLANTRLNNMRTQLTTLDSLRDEVDDTRITVLPVVTKYRTITRSLTEFNQTIADETGDTELRESVRTLTALSNARDQLSYETALMGHSLYRNSMTGGIAEAIDSSRARYDNEISNFVQAASPTQRDIFDENFTGLQVSQVSTMRMRVMYRAERNAPLSGVTSNDGPDDYIEIAGVALGKLQDVEEQVAEGIQNDAAQLRATALTRALIDLVVVAGVLLAVFILTSLVVRSLVRPLRTLEDGARRVAERDLPDAINRMQEAGAVPENVKVTPIEVDTHDEIGEVARAFDDVHRVALTLASDEAALRSNVNAMFVNLSRRSQTLVERQLRLIDGLEQSEQDSDRLSDLFQLDHLATRMRRNNENLLVLSGQDNTRKWAQPVPLVDVLRGAVSEVEQYERVNVRAPSHISVLGRPVNDVIHLVAELVENATSFSPHDTEVLVSAKTLDNGGVQVDVTDSGIGMAAEDLAAINARLASPPVIDVAVSRRMGLFVVSRLAHRHGIRMNLKEAHGGGTTAVVILPPDLLITPVEGQHALGGADSRLELSAAAPDTYADAEAAFASGPAAPEPTDTWQTQGAGTDLGAGLPKRQPGTSSRADEHPPSGQDLWNSGSSAGTESTGSDVWGTTGGSGAISGETGSQRRVVDPYDTPEETAPAPESTGHSLFDPAPREETGGSLFERPVDRSTDTGSFSRPADTGAFNRPSETGAFDRPADTGAFRRPSDTGAFRRPEPESYDAFGGGRSERPSSDALSGNGSPADAGRRRDESDTETFPAVSASSAPAAPSSTDWTTGGQRPPAANETGSWRSGNGAGENREGYGSTAYLSRRYGAAQGPAGNTVVPPTPGGEENDSLPIFDAIESNWFRRRTGGGPTVDATETGPIRQVPAAPAAPAAPSATAAPQSARTAEPETRSEQEWNSAADRGWKAARSAAEPIAGGLTTSGLPKRVPKANLVPGTAPKPENFKQMPTRSADRVRNRFSGFQKGVRDGRSRLGDGQSEG